MKILLFFTALLLVTQMQGNAQVSNSKKLEEIILKQIEKDKIEQKNFMILDQMNILNDSKNNFKKADSLQILYNGGWTFGFYLISSSTSENEAILEINTVNIDWKFPKNLIKEIRHQSNNLEAVYYEYNVKRPDEWFNFKLSFQREEPGFALVVLTVFSTPKT